MEEVWAEGMDKSKRKGREEIAGGWKKCGQRAWIRARGKEGKRWLVEGRIMTEERERRYKHKE